MYLHKNEIFWHCNVYVKIVAASKGFNINYKKTECIVANKKMSP